VPNGAFRAERVMGRPFDFAQGRKWRIDHGFRFDDSAMLIAGDAHHRHISEFKFQKLRHKGPCPTALSAPRIPISNRNFQDIGTGPDLK
jgi:hypothetical protein